MKSVWPILCLPLLVACAASDEMTSAVEGGTTYAVEFTPMWTATTHPVDYPQAGLLSAPHFSGVIGASHGEGYHLFAAGGMPSPGLEALSEQGKHSPLDAEIRDAIRTGRVGELFETGPIKDFSMPARGMVRVNEQFPLVSAAAMIAPSPDWFAGAADVALMENGRWVKQKQIVLYAYDSGGDAGTSYEAADADLSPKQPTMLNDARPFVAGGQRVPVATLTFTQQ